MKRYLLIGSRIAARSWCAEHKVSLNDVEVVQRCESLLGRSQLPEVRELWDACLLPEYWALTQEIKIIKARVRIIEPVGPLYQLRINGKFFACECGESAFRKTDTRYFCNACGAEYEGA